MIELILQVLPLWDRLTTDWTVRVRTPVGARFSAFGQTGPGVHPVPCTKGTGCISRG